MKSILGPGMVAGLSLVLAVSAMGQNQSPASQTQSTAGQAASSAPNHPSNLSAPSRGTSPESTYQYDFISKHYVWSNKPLRSTASKICQTMKDHAFAESQYAINNDQDWNSCLDTQIRSIGYMRWLANDGLKPYSKNRSQARAYLQKTYTMGNWGSYSFAELREAFKATLGQHQ